MHQEKHGGCKTQSGKAAEVQADSQEVGPAGPQSEQLTSPCPGSTKCQTHQDFQIQT